MTDINNSTFKTKIISDNSSTSISDINSTESDGVIDQKERIILSNKITKLLENKLLSENKKIKNDSCFIKSILKHNDLNNLKLSNLSPDFESSDSEISSAEEVSFLS